MGLSRALNLSSRAGQGRGSHTLPLGTTKEWALPLFPAQRQAADTLAPSGEFISRSEEEKQGWVPVHPSPGLNWEGGTGAAPTTHAWSHSCPGWVQGGPAQDGGLEPGGRGGRPASPEDGTGGGNKYWQARHATPGQRAQVGQVRLGRWLCLPRALCWGRGLWVWVLLTGTEKAKA